MLVCVLRLMNIVVVVVVVVVVVYTGLVVVVVVFGVVVDELADAGPSDVEAAAAERHVVRLVAAAGPRAHAGTHVRVARSPRSTRLYGGSYGQWRN